MLQFCDPMLNLNTTPAYYHWKPSMQAQVQKILNNALLLKKKYIVPPHDKINLIGMLIGPKGMYHKMLKQMSNCLMFIKGKPEEA